jgi:hypothetical protein
MRNFVILLSDRSILYAQSHEEYNQRFVFPALYPEKHEMATETEESLLEQELLNLTGAENTPRLSQNIPQSTGKHVVVDSPLSTPVKPVVTRQRRRRTGVLNDFK